MVVFFHFTLDRKEVENLFNVGSTGVDLFFIISGFVIFMSINNVKTSHDFIINRVSRLYPTYWTCVTITFILISVYSHYYETSKTVSVEQYVANMTMFQHFFRVHDLDGPYWTMIVEMMFYIGILLLFHYKLLIYIDYIGVLIVAFTLLAYQFSHIYLVDKFLGGFSFLRYSPLFFSGIIFYKLYSYKKNIPFYYSLLVICLCSQILLFDHLDKSWLINQNTYALMLVIYFTLFILFINNKLSFIVSKPTLFVGKISYALYLVHQFLCVHILLPFLIDTLQLNFWIACLITLPVVILLATAITYFIEIPMGKWLKQTLRNAPIWQKKLEMEH